MSLIPMHQNLNIHHDGQFFDKQVDRLTCCDFTRLKNCEKDYLDFVKFNIRFCIFYIEAFPV